MSLTATLSQVEADAGTMHSVVHGAATASVVTEGGTVPTLAKALAAIQGGTARGAWATSTAYAINDAASVSGLWYRCLIAHTAGTFATDLAAGKWVLWATDGSMLQVTASGGTASRTMALRERDRLNVRDVGAVGDNVADDSAAFTAAAAISDKVVRVPPGTYPITTATLTATGLHVEGSGLPTLVGKVTPGPGFHATGVRFYGPSSRCVEWTASGVTGVTLDRCVIESAADMAVHARGTGQDDTRIQFCTITTPNYGALLNLSTGQSGSRFSVVGNTITVVDADAVELNCPAATFRGTMTALNHLAVTSTTPNVTAGLGLGIAAAEFNVVLGNVFHDTLNEAIHIEDSQRGTSIVGNVGRPRGDGIRIFNDEAYVSGPVMVVGNSMQNGETGRDGTGIHLFWQTWGTTPGCCLTSNAVDHFVHGLHFGGIVGNSGTVMAIANGNAITDCTYATSGWGAINAHFLRQYGENYAHGCDYLFRSNGYSCLFGKVHSKHEPTGLWSTAGYGTALPSRCDGFSFPRNDTVLIDQDIGNPLGLFGGTALFPRGGAHCGTLRVIVSGGPTSGSSHWAHLTTDIKWDGTAFTATDKLRRVAGGITGITVTCTGGGSVYLNLFSGATQRTIERIFVEFSGEYWDA
jgi:hypothetical protein